MKKSQTCSKWYICMWRPFDLQKIAWIHRNVYYDSLIKLVLCGEMFPTVTCLQFSNSWFKGLHMLFSASTSYLRIALCPHILQSAVFAVYLRSKMTVRYCSCYEWALPRISAKLILKRVTRAESGKTELMTLATQFSEMVKGRYIIKQNVAKHMQAHIQFGRFWQSQVRFEMTTFEKQSAIVLKPFSKKEALQNTATHTLLNTFLVLWYCSSAVQTVIIKPDYTL